MIKLSSNSNVVTINPNFETAISSGNIFADFFQNTFLYLPVASIVIALSLTILSTITLILSKNKQRLVSSLLVNWWDLSKSIIQFWGQTLFFVCHLIILGFHFLRLITLTTCSQIVEITYKLWKNFENKNNTTSTLGKPWFAIILTIMTLFVETTLFTITTTTFFTAVLIDISHFNISMWLTTPLIFLILGLFNLASYLLFTDFKLSYKTRNYIALSKIFFTQIVIYFLQITFLYKELANLILTEFYKLSGVFVSTSTLSLFIISSTLWGVIRYISWKNYAKIGCEYIFNLMKAEFPLPQNDLLFITKNEFEYGSLSNELVHKIKCETNTTKEKFDKAVIQFLLPILQIMASILNFLSMLLNAKQSINLPFDKKNETHKLRDLLENIKLKANK